MATRNNTQNIRTYRRPKAFNIGAAFFGILFIYMIISIARYFTSSHVTSYEVLEGSLVDTTAYKAIAIRTEEVQTTEQAGNINYYALENEKIGTGSLVYSIDEGGRLSAARKENYVEGDGLTSKNYADIKSLAANFTLNFTAEDFSSVYNFKYEIEGNLLDYMSANTLDSLRNLSATGGNLFTRSVAPKEGIVIYSIDGMENITVADLTTESFDLTKYCKTSLRSIESVKAGDTAYKLITDENWSLAFPVDENAIAALSDLTSVNLTFLKDDTTLTADFSLVNNASLTLGVLQMDSSLIRYCTDRFVDIELLLTNKTGLKIPISSIVEKDFYAIPVEYLTYGGNNNEAGLLRQVNSEDGGASTEFIAVSLLYANDGTQYYIDTTAFRAGDIIVMPDSTQTYTIAKIRQLQGVYSINKAYAIFRQISIVDQNEEYCIVEEGTQYGISKYDHIVLDSSTVNEDDIVY